MPKGIDLSGRRFGRLTVDRQAPSGPSGRRWWCKCACGSPEKQVAGGALTGGQTRSCGCINRETQARNRRAKFPWRRPWERSEV